MTEDEAKTKWCPFAEQINGKPWLVGELIPEHYCCIASECMAWRATDNEFGPQPPHDASITVHQPGMPAGYCGLAGKL